MVRPEVGNTYPTDLGKAKLLAVKSHFRYGVIYAPNNLNVPYVAIWNPQVLASGKLIWSNGHYYTNLEDAMKHFESEDDY